METPSDNGTQEKTTTNNRQMLNLTGAVVVIVVVVFVALLALNTNAGSSSSLAAADDSTPAADLEFSDEQLAAAEALDINLNVLYGRYANVERSISEDGMPLIGDPDADVTITEYSSFTCGHCANFHDEQFMDLLANEITAGEVNFEFVPLSNQNTWPFAGLAFCADDLNDSFWEMHDILFDLLRRMGGSMMEEENLRQMALTVGADDEAFLNCLTQEEQVEPILARIQEASNLFYALAEEYPGEITGTPTIVFNGEPADLLEGAGTRSGARSIEYIRERIAALQ